jgi:hypothetical protein
MISKVQMRSYVKQLLEKTRKNEVRWMDSGVPNGVELLLPHSSIELEFESPSAELDRFKLTFNNTAIGSDRIPVETWVVEQDDEDADWQLLFQLYREATPITTGSDTVLADVEAALNTKGPIGIIEEPALAENHTPR